MSDPDTTVTLTATPACTSALADVAALYVRPDGPYPSLVSDVWDEARDARRYEGPYPVVAHPPCKRWGRYWWADGSTTPGEDAGLFEAALSAVRRFGGVLEHPEATHAWRVFDLPQPSLGSWQRGLLGGWATAVYQGSYGHRARKLTWLYYVGDASPPSLDWTCPGAQGVYLSQPGRCKKGKPRRRCPCDRCRVHFGDAWEGHDRVGAQRMSARENELTPLPFARLLVSMALRAAAPHRSSPVPGSRICRDP